MGSIVKLSNLTDVKPYKSEWRVEVKVIHKWISFNHQSGASIEMVLADENGVKIHASCKQSLMPKLESHFRVGEWKVITNFTLSPASGLNRTTNHVYKMEFLSQTSISDSNIQCHSMFLDLHDFDNMLNGSHDTCFLIDILGQAIEVGKIQTLQCGGKEKKKIEFQLRDISDERISCCLWGKFAEQMESHREEAQFGVVICLIRFAKIGAFRGNLQISNSFDSSQLVFNPNISEAKELRDAFKLHLVAKDDTGEAKFVLLDWIAWPVVGVKAEKILNGSLDEIEDPELLPDCLTEIVGKTYKFGVAIEKGIETFKVLKVWSVYNTLMVDSQSESISARGTAANSGSEVSLLTYSDESSSKMTTPAKRPVDDIVDIPDTTSTSKLRPFKNIKVEKMSS
ncbi:hypothetical protein Bca52824_001501 [Brassica carinata]|uniref:Replication protein A 70 kDa DNA-binding subunit B/D first OB fold domain-containing protein n=1 Tax=Brassica carinata TaxID=52824 RepID=A0A8X7WIN4_BRACI|nr:hypothetical protein Bca52824_001501 [Brassica carinata]